MALAVSEVVVILGQSCHRNLYWVPQFEAEYRSALDRVTFWYPPEWNGEHLWHPYTPAKDERYDRTNRATGYDAWLKTTGAELWSHAADLQEKGTQFAVVAFSNGSALGWEIALHFRNCACVLFTATVPVRSQQLRYAELSMCRTGFLHGTKDTWYFGGHEHVRRVADEMGSLFWEYDGGHSSDCLADVVKALGELMRHTEEPQVKRRCLCA